MTTSTAHIGQNTRIKAMRAKTSAGAEVRRDFRRLRPVKSDVRLPLHAKVVWDIALESLGEFRGRLDAAGLRDQKVEAFVVYVRADEFGTQPHLLAIEGPEPETLRMTLFETLASAENLAIGMAFDHLDPTEVVDGKPAHSTFPYQWFGLSEQGVLQLRLACVMLRSERPTSTIGGPTAS